MILEKPSKEQIKQICAEHQDFLQDQNTGKQADFSYLCLDGYNLVNENLRNAIFYNASLKRCTLQNIDFTGANFTGADLEFAQLINVNLAEADLTRAKLAAARLIKVNLHKSNLYCTDLRGTRLRTVDNLPDYLLNLYRQSLTHVLMYVPRSQVVDLLNKLLSNSFDSHCHLDKAKQFTDLMALLEEIKESHEDSIQPHEYKIPDYSQGIQNPAEQLFEQIRSDDSPEDNQFLQIIIDVIDQII